MRTVAGAAVAAAHWLATPTQTQAPQLASRPKQWRPQLAAAVAALRARAEDPATLVHLKHLVHLTHLTHLKQVKTTVCRCWLLRWLRCW